MVELAKDSPSNVFIFLMEKGLIDFLIFSERLELEEEFYHWCDEKSKRLK